MPRQKGSRGPNRELPAISPIDLAWLAGVLEGEGSFIETWVGRPKYHNVVICLKMTDRDVVDRVAALWNSGVYDEKVPRSILSRKVSYAAYLTGQRAIALMYQLWPHMGERRRAQISRLFDAWQKHHAAKFQVGAQMAALGG